MKRAVLVIVLLVLALLSVACDVFSSLAGEPPPPVEEPTAPAPSAATPLPLPVGACQSKLSGKVVNSANNQPTANVTIEIVSGAKTIKTTSDPNGLYGFAGLCAGEYTISVTPPGGKAQPGPKITLDGSKAVRADLSFK